MDTQVFISEKQGFGECLALCNALKELLRMRWDSPWRPVDDTKIQVDGAVMERLNVTDETPMLCQVGSSDKKGAERVTGKVQIL